MKGFPEEQWKDGIKEMSVKRACLRARPSHPSHYKNFFFLPARSQGKMEDSFSCILKTGDLGRIAL